MPYQRPYLVRLVGFSLTPICEAAIRNIALTSSTLTILETFIARILRTTTGFDAGLRTTLAVRVTVFFLPTTAAPTFGFATTRLGECEAKLPRLFARGRERIV